jgi:hypothetical protein
VPAFPNTANPGGQQLDIAILNLVRLLFYYRTACHGQPRWDLAPACISSSAWRPTAPSSHWQTQRVRISHQSGGVKRPQHSAVCLVLLGYHHLSAPLPTSRLLSSSLAIIHRVLCAVLRCLLPFLLPTNASRLAMLLPHAPSAAVAAL